MPEYVQWALVGAGVLLFLWMASGPRAGEPEEPSSEPRRRGRRPFRRWRPRRAPAQHRRARTALQPWQRLRSERRRQALGPTADAGTLENQEAQHG